ncbi:hypothetical protein DFH09DRAFT_1346829 [Mycena vulgaris]|nr:hypothetical protein DFH09DRAFT_1346829 [Mycena vulgaris]
MSALSAFESTLLCMTDSLLVHLLSFWDPKDILASATLSPVIHGILQHYRQLVWDVDIHFRPWFQNPAEFRSILRITGAVVSGSQILQFLDRTNYLSSDMDIFLRIGGVTRIGKWLSLQGYRFGSLASDYQTFDVQVQRLSRMLVAQNSSLPHGPPIRNVYNYQRFVASPSVTYIQKVQLVVVDMDPVHHVLFDFHSTAVMNYMTPDTIVSLFPNSTFVLRKTYVTKSPPNQRPGPAGGLSTKREASA